MNTLPATAQVITIAQSSGANTVQRQPLSSQRIAAAKIAYSTRRVDPASIACLLQGDLQPRAGDLILARVKRIGQHTRIELASGRRATLHVGDEVVVCYGARYAPDQFEAYVPDTLGPCQLVAAGGIAADCVNRHTKMKKPTDLQVLGLLADNKGRRLNLADWALPPVPQAKSKPYTIAVLGTAMNAGKTTTAASLIRGLRHTGLRVSATKVTGTGAGCDRWVMADAGALRVLDFTDAGAPSTFGLAPEQVEAICLNLVNHLADSGAEVIVLEVADGLYQTETAALLQSEGFQSVVDSVIFAAGDALGAVAGVAQLRRWDLPVAAVSGLLTAAPLAMREAQNQLDIPVVSAADLSQATWLPPALQASDSSAVPPCFDQSMPLIFATA